MKKFAVSLVAMLLMLCAALPCFAETPAGVLPVIRMEQQKQEFRNEKGQVCIVTDYNRLLVKNREAFPALAEALEAKHNRVWQEKLAADLEASKPDALELKKYRPEDYMHFLLEERLTQIYSDLNVISFAGEFYQNRGGARPLVEFYGYNFNPVTGKLYVLDDALAPGQRNSFLQNAVKPELARINKEEGRYFYENYHAIVDDLFARDLRGEKPLQWVWNGSGVRLYFDPDVLAPGIAGVVEVFVPADRFRSMFNESFVNPPQP